MYQISFIKKKTRQPYEKENNNVVLVNPYIKKERSFIYLQTVLYRKYYILYRLNKTVCTLHIDYKF